MKTNCFQSQYQVIGSLHLLKKSLTNKEIIELRSLELQVKEVRKRGDKIKTGDNEY